MLLLGLTGSIATGKSTVSRILAAPPHNLPIIDADLLARAVVAPGTPGFRRIVAHFGPSTPGLVQLSGELDRAVLGRRVFGDDDEHKRDRAVLNSIIHPLVRQKMYRAILWHYLTGHWAVVLDIPLLFESGLDLLCGAVLVVSVSSPEVQLSRLLARDKILSREDAERRVGSQMGIEEKRRRCESVFTRGRGRGWVVENDGTVEDLENKLAVIMTQVRSGRTGWWCWLMAACPPLAFTIGLAIVCRNWWRTRSWSRGMQKERAKL